jgi:hypothetical protein
MYARAIAKPLLAAALLSVSWSGDAAAKGALAGKVFFSPTKPKDAAPAALTKLFAKSKPEIALTQNDEKDWAAVLVAFFRKPAVGGPVTLWFYDKADKAALKDKEPVHIMTAQGATTVLVHDLLLRPDDGFNKGQRIIVMVGQILGKREQVYARGEITLK